MLLPGLNGQNESPRALGIDSLTHDTPRRATQPLVPRRQKTDVRAAERQRQSHGLPFADHNIGAKMARRFQDTERNRIDRRDE